MVYKLTTDLTSIHLYFSLTKIQPDPTKPISFDTRSRIRKRIPPYEFQPISLRASWIVPLKRNCGARNPATRYPEEQLRRNHHFLVRYFILSCAVPFIPYSSG
ncbi:hypothetical protein TNCT_590661 [Trichonephila clavata]|uniref:Uncharacterized protein n=1 Tax=Trichonephila clavata TaxID=2740835 RepID=A0A8X6HQ50_TRICU|nr:hypothetical protein TNCT_590661 [Trichonephila clavata]